MQNTRRALLLFALVLGVSAIVAAVLHPQDRQDQRDKSSPKRPPRLTGRPAPADHPVLTLDAGGRQRVLVARSGEALTLDVAVRSPGQVQLPSQGLVDSAEPTTPASFELRPSMGRFDVVFAPAGGGESHRVGTVVVRR